MSTGTYPRGLVLPSAPFARAIRKVVRAKAQKMGLSEDAMCKNLGIPIRQLRGWENGEYETISWLVADRILIQTPLHWWDVWEPAEYPEVAARLDA